MPVTKLVNSVNEVVKAFKAAPENLKKVQGNERNKALAKQLNKMGYKQPKELLK